MGAKTRRRADGREEDQAAPPGARDLGWKTVLCTWGVLALPKLLAGRAGDYLSRLSLGSPSPCAQQLCLAAGLHLPSVHAQQKGGRTLLTSTRGRIQCMTYYMLCHSTTCSHPT